jgi:UDPglucose 6-dehydrogenase
LGAHVRACDPVAATRMKEIYPQIEYFDSPLDAADGADGLLCLTEWDKFSKVNLKKLKGAMKTPVVVDGRNIFDPQKMVDLGFRYLSMGRPSPVTGHP